MSSRDEKTTVALCAGAHGFSLHAAVRCGAHQRKELERLCCYITRPAIANERLSRNSKGQVVLQLKSAYRDGTTHIVMSPLEFMQRLAAQIPAHARAAPRSSAPARTVQYGLSHKATTVPRPDRRPGSARVQAKARNCLEVRRLGPLTDSRYHRAGGIFSEPLAIDRLQGRRYSGGWSKKVVWKSYPRISGARSGRCLPAGQTRHGLRPTRYRSKNRQRATTGLLRRGCYFLGDGMAARRDQRLPLNAEIQRHATLRR